MTEKPIPQLPLLPLPAAGQSLKEHIEAWAVEFNAQVVAVNEWFRELR